MDVIRVHAPSEADALRLMASLDGGFRVDLEQDGAGPVVGLTPDLETATKLIELFNALGTWLSDGDLASCQIRFGDRVYTLVAATAGQPSDATAFLLERTIQLQTALDSRIVIEQAKGILAERHGITPDDAFTRLRRDARSRRMKLHNVAAEVIRTTRNG